MDQRNSKLVVFFIVITIKILLISSLSVSQADIWYVDCAVASSGDCASWENACSTIQEAIDVSAADDEIWVKQGTYSISSTIDVNKSILLFGGFDGTETERDQRDWSNNLTILDGENSGARRMYVQRDAIISGLIITGGNGGGMLISRYSSPLIKNCIFEANSATQGAGIYNGGSLIITNCSFIRNSAIDEEGTSRGGAIFDSYSGGLTISDCTFSENTANAGSRNHGGGIFNDAGPLTITNCVFFRNTVFGDDWNYGGGIYSDSRSLTISNCIFSENTAMGGRWNHGGGVYLSYESQGSITNSTFVRNSAVSGYPRINDGGGGIYLIYGANMTLTNCILWYNNNSYQQIFFRESRPIVSYSNINEMEYEGVNGNIREEPLFVDYELGDYHLQEDSPCIDTGDPDFDYSNELGPNGCRINMGAYGNTIEATLSFDLDSDGFYGYCDNCPHVENSIQEDTDGSGIGDACNDAVDRDGDEWEDSFDNCPDTPSSSQEDSYPPQGDGIGNVCDCEGDFDCDGDQDGTDTTIFKLYFGRGSYYYPCTEIDPCRGDFDCDQNIDGSDAMKFKEDFGRNVFNNICPECVIVEVGEWCNL